jgi:lipopolysaccharide/colanic/teichoic acid biosynthesis glycosyltransferase
MLAQTDKSPEWPQARETNMDHPALSETREQRVWRTDSSHSTSVVLVDDSCISPNWYVRCKIVVEWLFALVLLIVTGPLILLAALAVKVTSRGPAFYSQTRLGRRGKPFRIHKVRTMTHNCENATGATWAKVDDPRITPVGRFLRRSHLDELPQLINVLRGEMSIVGPRPERPEFIPKLEQAVPHYSDRLLVRPGVTGLAQVQLPADTDLASVRRKLAYDLYYIRHISLWLDARLIACTVVHCFGVPFHVLCRLFKMPRRDEVENAYKNRPKSGPALLIAELQPT